MQDQVPVFALIYGKTKNITQEDEKKQTNRNVSWRAKKYANKQSRDHPDIHTESPSGNVGLDSGGFLITTELFERANQIVACPITGTAHWHTSAYADANW